MMRFLKAILALLLIGLGVAIGWYFADSTNPYKPGNQTPTAAPVAAAAANTPIPTFTAAGATTATNTTPGTGAGAGTAGQRAVAPISGTLESYDAATKVLTVKTTAGQSVKVGANRATVLKPQKLTADEFTQGLTANSFVLVGGDKGADGAYNAKSLTTIDLATLAGGAGGFAGARPGGQAGAATTPGAGQGARPGGQAGAGAGAAITPGAQGQAGGQRPIGAGAGAGNLLGNFGFGTSVAVRGGTLAGTKFTGNTLQGEAVTANISGDTLFQKQIAGVAEDLKPGLSVTVVAPVAQGATPAEATIINIG